MSHCTTFILKYRHYCKGDDRLWEEEGADSNLKQRFTTRKTVMNELTLLIFLRQKEFGRTLPQL
jgi:hypothetical protein